ncbi:LysR family transcriptional regulator [bacterium]|nr:LysR family transcriptional regulator [bacterium]
MPTHDLPPLKALRAFDACIRLGSFTRAAAELNVGQPAISHQIQALERDLGLVLFERRGAQALATDQAVAYHRSIAAAFDDMARATLALRRSARPPGLTLATYPGIAMFWLMPRLDLLRQTAPGLAVRVTTAERDRDMQIDTVDCAILFGDGNWPGFESRLLMREAVVPVAAPAVATRLAGWSRRDLLENGPLIHLEDNDARWFTWRDWHRERAPDAARIAPGVQVTNHGIALHQTLMGQGVSLGWRGVIDDLVENRLLTALDIEPLVSERGYHLVTSAAFLKSDTGRQLQMALNPRPAPAAP